jgi:hypothetical protein
MTLFVYELHELVSRKLLNKKWQGFLEDHSLTGPVTALTPQQVWTALNSQPTLGIIYKRQVFTENEPINLDSTWLLLLAIVQRASPATEPNVRLFLTMISRTLRAEVFLSAQRMGEAIATCGSNLHLLFEAYQAWLQYQTGRAYTRDDFMHVTQLKLDRMISSGCGAGTCR